jgi:hypothetical protein
MRPTGPARWLVAMPTWAFAVLLASFAVGRPHREATQRLVASQFVVGRWNMTCCFRGRS